MFKYCVLFIFTLLVVTSCISSSAAAWAQMKSTLSGIVLVLFMVGVFFAWLTQDE